MEETHEIVNIIYIYAEEIHGVLESLGAYASMVKYTKDGIDYEELIDNEEFVILEEIVFTYLKEE